MTYRGAKATFYRNFLNTEVRFGSIASSSLNHKVAEEFETVSCFEIYTCEGADITKYSRYPDEKEVLIPPYEMFKVTAVRTRRDQKHLWCETVFTLKSSGRSSHLKCAVIFTADKWQDALLFSILFSFSLLPYYKLLSV